MKNRLTISFLALAILLGTVPTRSSANESLAPYLLFWGSMAGLATMFIASDMQYADKRKVWDVETICSKNTHAYADKQLSEIIRELQQNNPKEVNAFKQPCHMLVHKLMDSLIDINARQDLIKSLPLKAFDCFHSQEDILTQITATIELLTQTLHKALASAEYTAEKQRLAVLAAH